MTQVAVIHTAFEETPRTVALVEVDENMSLGEKLEYAYRWTQNIMDSWSMKLPEDGNDNVLLWHNFISMKKLERLWGYVLLLWEIRFWLVLRSML